MYGKPKKPKLYSYIPKISWQIIHIATRISQLVRIPNDKLLRIEDEGKLNGTERPGRLILVYHS